MAMTKKETGTIGDRTAHTEASLPISIGNLFKMNNYDIEYDVNVHGSQIDIIAKAKGDPFSLPVYIEATVEYVSTEKYGKDTTKFMLLARKQPGSTLLCVSSKGFTAFVKERALESGVTALSYDELFAKFEKFTPYLIKTLSDSDNQKLNSNYEEPLFNDAKGVEPATKWLGYWKGFAPENTRWLIVLGEYGTGKTSLTRILQHRWLQDYHSNPSSPIPVRIELRNFSRQFDAKGLLHHFLDTNDLSHVPIEFMMHLIKTGRVILILDGYDEMAQFLNARERRACLSALAELAADGAKGILTSRPNYFTENEELNVFEALYKTLDQNKFHISRMDQLFIAEEQSVDELVERYVLNRYERSLQDLTPTQTESLVRRSLAKDVTGQNIVLGILAKVFREEDDGKRQALSGKPVIIAYLLELVDEIRKEASSLNMASLTEWQIYKLIIDRLMFRDLRRSTLNPADRRRALQKLAIKISGRELAAADENTFYNIIDEDFQSELKRLPTEERRARRIELFEDLRSSATLTRAVATKNDGWVFSHNSLREFLVAERFLDSLIAKAPIKITIPVSSAMRGFIASIADEDIGALWQALSEVWPQRASHFELGPYLTLMWDAARKLKQGMADTILALGNTNQSKACQISDIAAKDLDFSRDFFGASLALNANDSSLSEFKFDGIDLRNSSFNKSVLDTTSFRDADLRGVLFKGALIFECDLSGASLKDADFTGLEKDSSIIIANSDINVRALVGNQALGYLRFNGAITDDVDNYSVYSNHPKFSIIQKICEKVVENKNSQLRGLTQRGESRVDPPFARSFVDKLVGAGWLFIDKNDLVSVTQSGRSIMGKIVTDEDLPHQIAEFLENHD